MPVKSTETEEMQTQSSSISKAIIIGALIIAASNLVGSGVIKPKSATTALAPQPSPAAQAVQGAQAAPTTPPKATTTLGHFPVKGNNNAKVAIIEFADFRCPFCERYFTSTLPQVMKDYVDTGKAKLSFRHYEFLGQASTTAGNAAECANEQGKFWEYHDWLYKNQPPETDTSLYTSDKLSSAAESVGINKGQFKACLDANKFDKNVSQDLTDGQAAGINGTPSFVIGKLDASGTKVVDGTLLVGAQPYNAFQAVIDPLLK